MKDIKYIYPETVYPLNNGTIQVTRLRGYCDNCDLYVKHEEVLTQGDTKQYHIRCEHLPACNYAINATIFDLKEEEK